VIYHPLTVAAVALQRETVTCSVEDTLSDACESLVSSGRTAAVVLDNGRVCGVLTENDILQAYVEDVSWVCSIGDWLKGGDARLPGFMVPVLTLPPDASIAEAAACMLYQMEE
ncbi:unnamed protein product, partial [Polarella glacialis]